MNFSKPSTLGIVACPGGENFANETISHLKRVYSRRFEKKASALAKRYGKTREEVIREINFYNDIRDPRVFIPGNSDAYRVPAVKVPCKFTRFANGEMKASLQQSVRGMDIFIFQDTENSSPLKLSENGEPVVMSVNDHIFNLLVTIDAVQCAGPKRVTVVIPSYPYARQHKKNGREGLTASQFGRILENMGVRRIITLDIHSKEIEHTFGKLHLENLHASYQILRKLTTITDVLNDDIVVVSPDTGAISRNKYFAGCLKRPLAMLYKERDYSKVSTDAASSNITSTKLLGDVRGKTVFMGDDMLGTGGTMIKAMEYLKNEGAEKIICAISLPLFTGNAIQAFDEAYEKGLFYRIIGTNAVHSSRELLDKEWYVRANVSNLFARIIARLHHDRSLSPLLDNSRIIQSMLEKECKKRKS